MAPGASSNGVGASSVGLRRVALLIGPTGQGKSTSGSYLVDPLGSEKSPTFRRASGMHPMTQHLESAKVSWSGGEIDIVDTPGLDESSVADLRHMVQVYSELQAAGSISAIILCVRVDRKLDQPFKILLDFWRRLFRDMLRTNFFVIMTNVKMDEASVEQRQADGFDLGAAEADLQEQLRGIFEAESNTFTIIQLDGRPYGVQAKEVSNNSRSLILNKIASLPLVDVSTITFAKLPDMLKEDQALKMELDGKISGYTDAQGRLERSLGEAAKKLQEVNSALQTEEQIRNSSREQLANLENVAEVEVDNFNCTKEWRVGWTKNTVHFSLTSKHPICRTAENLGPQTILDPKELKVAYEGREYKVKGSATGGWILGLVKRLYVNITIYSHGKDYHASDMKALSEKIRQADKKISEFTTKKSGLLEHQNANQAELRRTQAYIDEFTVEAAKLSKESMTLSEAIERLDKMIAKSASTSAASFQDMSLDEQVE